MPEEILYLKGYKLDRQKIRAQFPRKDNEPEANYEMGYYNAIFTHVPETAYKYVACGKEPNGIFNVMIVLEDGYDQTALNGDIVTPATLPEASLKILTPDIWPAGLI